MLTDGNIMNIGLLLIFAVAFIFHAHAMERNFQAHDTDDWFKRRAYARDSYLCGNISDVLFVVGMGMLIWRIFE